MLKKLAISSLVCGIVLGPAWAQEVTGDLIIYSGQTEADANEITAAFNTLFPEVEIELYLGGTTKVMGRLRTEIDAGNPRPDVVIVTDVLTAEALEAEGVLMAYPEADTSAYDPALSDPEGYYFSTKLITTGIVYNTTAEVIPTSYQDLLDDAVANQIVLASPLTSGAATVHMTAISEQEGLGWDFFEELAEGGVETRAGNLAAYEAVAEGEKLYGFGFDFLTIREQREGAPVEFVVPSEGVTAVTEPVAILETAKNPQAAKAFVDFLLSAEGQTIISQQGYLPAHPEIAPPEGFPPRQDIKLIHLDPERALENDLANKQRFLELFGN